MRLVVPHTPQHLFKMNNIQKMIAKISANFIANIKKKHLKQA